SSRETEVFRAGTAAVRAADDASEEIGESGVSTLVAGGCSLSLVSRSVGPGAAPVSGVGGSAVRGSSTAELSDRSSETTRGPTQTEPATATATPMTLIGARLTQGVSETLDAGCVKALWFTTEVVSSAPVGTGMTFGSGTGGTSIAGRPVTATAAIRASIAARMRTGSGVPGATARR